MMNRKSVKDLLLYFGIAAVFLLSDSVIKDRVENPDKKGNVLPIFKEGLIFNDNIRLRYLKNYGAAGSMLKNKPEIVKALSVVFASISAAELAHICETDKKILQKLGLSLILAGGASNTIDRVTKGYVTDYFSLNKAGKKLSSLVFNISDFEIFAGSLLYSIGKCIEE